MTTLTSEIVERIIKETIPSYQATSPVDQNLGFGFIFYGFARTLRPRRTLVIGSKAGFSVLCFALAIRHNAGTCIRRVECYDTKLDDPSAGKLVFVDPSYSVDRDGARAWSGIGRWDRPEEVASLWESFGVAHIVTHVKETSQSYSGSLTDGENFDLVYIDGDHSYEGVLHDLKAYHPFVNPTGMVIAHDVAHELSRLDPNTGGHKALVEVTGKLYRSVTVPVFPGLALMTPISLATDDNENRCTGAPER